MYLIYVLKLNVGRTFAILHLGGMMMMSLSEELDWSVASLSSSLAVKYIIKKSHFSLISFHFGYD